MYKLIALLVNKAVFRLLTFEEIFCTVIIFNITALRVHIYLC